MSGVVSVWRICARRRAEFAFTGEGAARHGGRWNLPRTRLVYCAESRALAALEILAHAGEIASLHALEWVCLRADLPERCIERPARFPAEWRRFPHPLDTQEFGSTWAAEARSAVLRVPSAVVAGEFNYLLNPAHPDFSRIALSPPEPFSFDPRLAQK